MSVPSPEIRDLSAYGISVADQRGWAEVDQGLRDKPPFPEALKDKTKPVVVLNMADEYVRDYRKSILRNLVAKIDGVFQPGLQTPEMLAGHSQFHDDFRQTAHFDDRTFVFGRTRVLHLPTDQYELTVQPTQWTPGRMRVKDTPPEEAVAMFDLEGLDPESEIVLIAPEQTKIDDYAAAVFSVLGKTPHVSYWTVVMFADNVNWSVMEFRPGIKNLMGREVGAL